MSTSNVQNTFPFKLHIGESVPMPAPTEVIEVRVSGSAMLGNFAKAFVSEADRKNPNLLARENLTQEEMVKYAEFLMAQRVAIVHDDCKIRRQLKPLYIPTFIQYCLAMIGEVTIRDKGFKIVPVYDDDTISLDEARIISEKIGAFENYMSVVVDAMPYDPQGDIETMTTALIADRVCSMEKVNVVKTYLTAFLNFQLRKEADFKILYRIQYDDLGYLETALASQRGIL